MKNGLRLLGVLGACALLQAPSHSQQVADPNFDAKVARPAYTSSHPKVLFDEAHHNFHTATGRYQPFADLITNDGYTVTPNKEKFQPKTLAGFDVLIIANALGAERQNMPDADKPAFTDKECDAVRDWVRAGGNLLLVADHAPFGAAAERLASRFAVDMSKGHTSDTVNFDPETRNLSFLVFSRENKLLGEHSITHGRDATEQINRVLTFTGQSLKGPAGSDLVCPHSLRELSVLGVSAVNLVTKHAHRGDAEYAEFTQRVEIRSLPTSGKCCSVVARRHGA